MQFTIRQLSIPAVLVLSPRRFADSRGYFMVTYETAEFRRLGLPDFVQDNQSLSLKKGTVRGLHFQRPPHAQGKLVRVLKGAIFDAAVDLREGSLTYGEWAAVRLDAAAGEQVFVPRGFAHGFCTLEDNTEVAYKCDDVYAPAAEGGVLFSDPSIGIEWPVPVGDAFLSERDRAWPLLEHAGMAKAGAR